jgi:hypothetical protein
MRKIESVSVNNFLELKKELTNSLEFLDKNFKKRENNPECIRIYDLLDTDTSSLKEFDLFKQSILNKFELTHLQIVIYCPFSLTGFHIDGMVNRYIIPINSSENSINLEADITHTIPRLNDYNEYLQQYSNNFKSVVSIEQLHLEGWFKDFSPNNKIYRLAENECWEIGQNPHTHINISFYHRIIIVFDTKKPINEN